MIKYINELKHRLSLLFLCWISVFLTGYCYKEVLLIEFLKLTCFETKDSLNNFIFTNVTELFSTYINMSFFISNQIVGIYLVYNILIFLTPGLYRWEYRMLKQGFQLIVIFWLVSFVFVGWYLAPLMWKFFLSFQDNLVEQHIDLNFDAKIFEYLSFITALFYSYDIQSFLFVCLFITFGYLKNMKFLMKVFRKFFYLLFLLLSTFLTPPDITSQLITFIFLILFFELIISLRFFFINIRN